LYGMADDIWCI